MPISVRIEEIARAVVVIDPTDLPALVRLQDDLLDLAGDAGADKLPGVRDTCRRAAETVESIVLRSVERVEAAMGEVRAAVEYLQALADAAAEGRDPAGVPAPSAVARGQAADRELLEAWISSSEGALAELEGAVVAISDGAGGSEQVGEARRIIHTIKGEAGVLSLEVVQRVCHEAETLIDSRRGGTFPVDATLAVVDWVRACVAALASGSALPKDAGVLASIRGAMSGEEGSGSGEKSVARAAAEPSGERGANAGRGAGVETGTNGGGLVVLPAEAVIDDTTREFVVEAREHIAGAEQSILEMDTDLGNTDRINTVFRAFHTIKGVSGFMHLTPIVRLTHVAETMLDKARSGSLALTPGHLDLLLRSCDVLGQLLALVQGSAGPRTEVFETLVRDLERACAGVAPAVRAPAAPSEPGAVVAPVAATEGASVGPRAGQGVPASAGARAGGEGGAKVRVEQAVKVNTTRMDALVDMVGELVIGFQMVVQDERVRVIREQKTQRTLGHVSKIIRDLQEVAMSLRLVTLRATFQKMARLVRDVSGKAGKSVRLHLEGEDVELDRTVVEEIADPLVHMIRNACDHGIEGAEARREAGKSPEGNVWLRAYHQGGSIVVEIADDGRGLNRERILKKALEKGIYTPERNPSEIPDSEVYNLIFLPGFSTADKVTDISGRGVGMDVVRRNIEALRGKVEIDSTPGQGSRFRMRLPLTMAIIDGMVVRVGRERFVIPTLSIEQSLRPGAGEIHTVVNRGEMVKIRGELLPVHRARRVLGLGEGAEGVGEGLLLVLESHGGRYGLFVDEILGQQQVVIKTLGRGVSPMRGVAGGAILGDGRVALILDVRGLAAQATECVARE